MWVPQRLSVLVRYGEGPHISALSILAFALGVLLDSAEVITSCCDGGCRHFLRAGGGE